jgi:hypothetical protein
MWNVVLLRLECSCVIIRLESRLFQKQTKSGSLGYMYLFGTFADAESDISRDCEGALKSRPTKGSRYQASGCFRPCRKNRQTDHFSLQK